MKLRLDSLQARVLVLLVCLVSVAWSIAAAINSVYSMRTLDELLDRHLEQAAAVLIARQVGDIDNAPETDATLPGAKPERVAYQVWHHDALVMRSPNAPTEPMARDSQRFTTRSILGSQWRVYNATVGDELRIYVGERMAVREQILYTVVRSALWTLSIALPLLAVAGWWSVRAGLAPLRQLGRAIAGRRPQSLEAIELKEPVVELQPVVAALNRLFQRIAALLESERRFTADAAHELRTPIAAIRIQAEVAYRAVDVASRTRALEQTLAGCDHAKHVVEQLLTMARLEADAVPEREVFDLGVKMREVAAQIAPAALARGQKLVLDCPDTLMARGNPTLIGVLVRNLLDNGIRYSPDGATLRATAALQQGRIQVTVEDGGPGLTDEQRARLGERFFRVLGTDEPGSGLGWSIVRRIAHVHELQIGTSCSKDLGGLRIDVLWPEADSVPAAAEQSTPDLATARA